MLLRAWTRTHQGCSTSPMSAHLLSWASALGPESMVWRCSPPRQHRTRQRSSLATRRRVALSGSEPPHQAPMPLARIEVVSSRHATFPIRRGPGLRRVRHGMPCEGCCRMSWAPPRVARVTEVPVLEPEEQRVLGSLLEKQTTVPASYPLPPTRCGRRATSRATASPSWTSTSAPWSGRRGR